MTEAEKNLHIENLDVTSILKPFTSKRSLSKHVHTVNVKVHEGYCPVLPIEQYVLKPLTRPGFYTPAGPDSKAG